MALSSPVSGRHGRRWAGRRSRGGGRAEAAEQRRWEGGRGGAPLDALGQGEPLNSKHHPVNHSHSLWLTVPLFTLSDKATRVTCAGLLTKTKQNNNKKGEEPAVTCSVLENQSVCGQNRQVGPFTWTRSIKKKKTSDYFIDVDLKTCASILTPTNKWTFAIADCLKVFLRRAYLRNICPLSTRTFWKVAGKSNSSSPRLASPHRKRSWPRITFRCKCQLHFPIIWHHTCRWLPTRVHGHHFPHALGEQNLTRTFKNHTFTHPRPAVKLITQT